MNKNRVVWGNRGWMPVHYGFCPNEAAWKHLFSEYKMEHDGYPTYKACTSLFQRRDTKHRVAIVTIRDFPPHDTVDLLVHEAMHVWRDIREGIGEKEPSSEFEAYAIQNIAADLFSAYEKTRGPLFVKRRVNPSPSK